MDLDLVTLIFTVIGGVVGWGIRFFQDRKARQEAKKEHQELVQLRKEHNEKLELVGQQQTRIAKLQEDLYSTHSKLNEAVQQISQLQVDEANSFVWEISHRSGHEYYLTNRSNRTALNVQLKSDSPMFRDVFTAEKLQSGNSLIFNYAAVMGGGDHMACFVWQDEAGGDFESEDVRFDKNCASTFRFRSVPNNTEYEG